MIHILKTNSGFHIQYCGKNGEILTYSEVLGSKQSAWKNIRAVMSLFYVKAGSRCTVKDEHGVYWSMWYWNGRAMKTKCTGGRLADLRRKHG